MSEKLLHYKPHIDGLRGLAVLLVVLYHAFPKQFKAGFVGVDIFFVISGYLITGIIFRQLEENKFSFTQFYARRIIRLFPALFVLLITILFLASFLFLPEEFILLAKHMIGASTFTTNIYLWHEEGYFDVASQLKPLLHLWSLGVEEQYYLFWPFLLIIWFRYKLKVLYLIVGLFILSFAFCAIESYSVDKMAFYLFPFRIWEFMTGSALVYWQNHMQNKQQQLFSKINFSFLLALFFFLCSLFFIDSSKIYPGLFAILPVFSAVFFINSDSHTWLGKILSNKNLVFIGKISYPLYLWHWPLLSIITIIDDKKPTFLLLFPTLLCSVFLAFLTYRFVELPIQKKFSLKANQNSTSSSKNKAIICYGLCAMFFLIFLCGLIIQFNGFAMRQAYEFSPSFYFTLFFIELFSLFVYFLILRIKIKNKSIYLFGFSIVVVFSVLFSFFQKDHVKYLGLKNVNQLLYFNAEGEAKVCLEKYHFVGKDLYCYETYEFPKVILLGDSHAAHLVPGLASQVSLIQMGKGNCPPLLGVETYYEGIEYGCLKAFTEAFQLIENKFQKTPLVILSNQIPFSLNDEIDGDARQLWQLRPTDNGKKNLSQLEIYIEGLSNTITKLEEQGKVVVLFIDIPKLNFDPKRCIYHRPMELFNTYLTSCRVSLDYVENFQLKYRAVVQELLLLHPTLKIFDPKKYFCNEKFCSVIKGNDFLYRDVGHLTNSGSLYISRPFLNMLNHLPDINMIWSKYP